MSLVQEPPVIIIGAGAAGIMAAIWAACGPRPVLLLEGTGRPGQKILISGGGRCNVLPSQAAPADFHTDGSRHTLAKILRAWPLAEVRRFFEEDLGTPLALETETGKLFPVANRSQVVLNALLSVARARGVTLSTEERVVALRPDGDYWRVQLADGRALLACGVVLATGGLSVPATGSDGGGLHIAQVLGHRLAPTYPALVPLMSEDPGHRALAGVTLPVTLLVEKTEGRQGGLPQRPPLQVHGGFLFTHRGYSGPAVLNVSHEATRSSHLGGPRPTIWVQWTPLDAAAWDDTLRTKRGPISTLLRGHLPARLADLLLDEAGLQAVHLHQLRREDRRRLVALLTHYPLRWHGHEGYKTAEVTGGGVALDQVNPVTLESRHTPGLYLCGEMLDVFGPIGGYNFMWAWVTGRMAGQAVGQPR